MIKEFENLLKKNIRKIQKNYQNKNEKMINKMIKN